MKRYDVRTGEFYKVLPLAGATLFVETAYADGGISRVVEFMARVFAVGCTGCAALRVERLSEMLATLAELADTPPGKARAEKMFNPSSQPDTSEVVFTEYYDESGGSIAVIASDYLVYLLARCSDRAGVLYAVEDLTDGDRAVLEELRARVNPPAGGVDQ